MNKRAFLKKISRYKVEWKEDGSYHISFFGKSILNFKYLENTIAICLFRGNRRLFSIPYRIRHGLNFSPSTSFSEKEEELISTILTLQRLRGK